MDYTLSFYKTTVLVLCFSLIFKLACMLVGHQEEHLSVDQKAPQGGCGHRRQHARLR